MSDLKLFRIEEGKTSELKGSAASLEKSLQALIEKNLENMLGITFIASEHSTGSKHRGRIDTLGIDENGSPVIIEYKRAVNENVINQGLFYLDWLMDHRAEFELMVMKELGKEKADKIVWSSPRLVCIANDYTRYDEHAVLQMDRNIELFRYRKFGNELLLLELINAVTTVALGDPDKPSKSSEKTITVVLSELKGDLEDLYEELKAFLLALGDDVQLKTLKYYIAFKRIKNFACVEAHPGIGNLKVYVKVDPDSVPLEDNFTRDVRNIGHFGTGDLEITLRSSTDLEKVKHLLLASYEAN